MKLDPKRPCFGRAGGVFYTDAQISAHNLLNRRLTRDLRGMRGQAT